MNLNNLNDLLKIIKFEVVVSPVMVMSHFQLEKYRSLKWIDYRDIDIAKKLIFLIPDVYLHFVPVDCDVLISVRASLFMLNSHDMESFMNDDTF